MEVLLAILTTVAAVASAIVAVVAACAAARSARASELMAQNSAHAERRAMVREIVISGQNIADERAAIEAVLMHLEAQVETLCLLNGHSPESSGLARVTKKKIHERRATAAAFAEHATAAGNDHSQLLAASPDDLSKAQAQLSSDLTKLRVIHAESDAVLSDVRLKCEAARERRRRGEIISP